MSTAQREKISGLLLGQAVGDALGLPREGLSPSSGLWLYGKPPLRHALFFGRGLTSDDTEHACLTASALLAQPDDVHAFARSLAWGLRGWLLGLPAGIGWATLRSTLKLWVGVPPEFSGVYSAGNGPLMRATVLGACLAHEPEKLAAYVGAATRMTHSDPQALEGALAIALAAAEALRHPPGRDLEPLALLSRLSGVINDKKLLEMLGVVERHLRAQSTAAEFAAELGLRDGVTGYVHHTAATALFCWLRWKDDFRSAVTESILLGGDADTVAAITGALAGASLGEQAIPDEWLSELREWPRSMTWMKSLAGRLGDVFILGRPSPGPLPLFWPGILIRNAFFTLCITAHAFNRLRLIAK